ncbi:hypothetical protein, partial [Rhizobium leguminosarum]|uniref:hypothetical protein n=1 Tax=Rhizobium leguminosarum TaxID=384 RepID=UPI001C98748F
ATNRRRSSKTEVSLHGINTSRSKTESVTHVSGTKRHLSLRSGIPERASIVSFWLGIVRLVG